MGKHLAFFSGIEIGPVFDLFRARFPDDWITWLP